MPPIGNPKAQGASKFQNIGKKVGLSLLGLPGLLIARSQNKAAAASAEAGPQQAGNKGNEVGKKLLKALLFPPSLLFDK